ncbi:hypothetical protein CMV_022068 [Castanea mollissima]|uniref:Uncharacterized protein n=1 Tax=Castanea mollissima TaxID=60419 RepID=A0A8J4QK74_9ROSI|nr:hypothetical protein CMV_022068 [Castanea mollissima]
MSSMTSNASTRKTFIDSSITIGTANKSGSVQCLISKAQCEQLLAFLNAGFNSGENHHAANVSTGNGLANLSSGVVDVCSPAGVPATVVSSFHSDSSLAAFDSTDSSVPTSITSVPACTSTHEPPSTPIRRSSRQSTKPANLQDYVCATTHVSGAPYDVADGLTYSHLEPYYCYNGTIWVGYDDVKSILAKVMYAKGKKLLGCFAICMVS